MVLLDGQPFFPVGIYDYPMQVITNSGQPYTGVYLSRTVGDRDVNHLAELDSSFNVIVLDDHGQDLEPADTCVAADIQNCRQYGLAVIKSFDCSGAYDPAWLAQTNQVQIGSPLYQSLTNTLHAKNLLWIETKDEASFGDDPSRIYPGTPWPTYEQFTNVNLFIHNTETNHLLWFNDGNYLGLPGSDRIVQLQKWGQWCDIYSEDLYPDFTNSTSGTMGEPASNLDWVRNDIAPTQPNFMILQGSGGVQNGYAPTNGQCASYLQTRCMAWDSIVHGARGVMWWGTFFLDRNGSDWV
ncbi:MAG TPA: hypothetical protein VFF11_17050, partial [Candidatus Binatia bacterium]|nr:hypothetical protein [Candidatus Binatia bacterium]